MLRGIMYGADKIPDSWFEKVPGGFYKQKESERRQHEKDEKRHSRSRRDRSRRRRHSEVYEDRRPRYDDEDHDKERSGRTTDRRRRHARSQSSYDGGADYDSEELERERRHGRRRDFDDDDRYGYDDGSSRRSAAKPAYVPSHYPDSNINAANRRDAAAAAAASAGTAAAMAHQYPRQNPVASPPIVPVAAPVPGAVPATYMPYAHIYGSSGAHPQSPPQMYSPPPLTAFSPVQPSNVVPGASPLVPPGHPVPNTAYAPRGFPDSYHSSQSRRRDSQFQSPSPSPSFDSTGKAPQRARSERRPHRDNEKSRGK